MERKKNFLPNFISRLKPRSRSSSRRPSSPSERPESTQPLADAIHGTASVPDLPTNTPGTIIAVQVHPSGDTLQENIAQATLTIEGDTVPTISLVEAETYAPSKGDVPDSSATAPAPVTSGSSRLAYNATTQILSIVQEAAGALPIAGSPLSSAIGGVLKVLNVLDACTFFFSTHF
jgi:hypothetical protein